MNGHIVDLANEIGNHGHPFPQSRGHGILGQSGDLCDDLPSGPHELGEFNPEDDIAIHCRSGMRSAKACSVLRAAGFQHVRNVVSGILAWRDRVDPSVPKY